MYIRHIYYIVAPKIIHVLHTILYYTVTYYTILYYTLIYVYVCIGISKTQSGRYLILGVDSKETTEQHLIDLTIPYTSTNTDRKLICISPRLFGHRYDCEHYIPKTSKKEGVKEVDGIYSGNI